MSSNSNNIGLEGPLLALLNAANNLSTEEIHDKSPTPASGTQSNDEQSIAIINADNLKPSDRFLTRMAKVEMVSMAQMDQPVLSTSNHVDDAPSAIDGQLPMENVVLSLHNSIQPSPMTAPSLSTSLESNNAPDEASGEEKTAAMPLFGTGNIRFNIDKVGNALSIPVEKMPEKGTEKNYYNFKDGYDTEEEIGPFWDAVLGEEEEDDDVAPLPELTNDAPYR